SLRLRLDGLGRRRRSGHRARRARRLGLRLLVTGQDVLRAFPGAHEVEIAEVLRELDRRTDDALRLFRIAQLDIAGEREILALRMALEAVIGEDAPEVRVAVEQHAVHVVDFALEPARDRPDAGD